MDGHLGEIEETTSWAPDGELEEFFRDQTMVVPFLGAGFSAAGGLPGAEDFKAALVSEFELDLAGDTLGLFGVANMIGGADMEKSLELRRFAASYFDGALEQLKPDRKQIHLLDNIVQVPSKLIVTMNYDGLLEVAARRHYRSDQIEIVAHRETLARGVQRAREKPGEKLMIIHLHGNVANPETIVLDKWGYESLESVTAANFFRSLMESRKLCFLGTTFDETNHIARLMQTGLSSQRHILFATERTACLIDRRASLDPYTHHVEVQTLPSRETLLGLVKYLARIPSPHISADKQDEVLARIENLVDDFYIESTLIPWKENAQNSEWAHLLSQAQGGHWRKDSAYSQFEHERALANEGHVLVLGPPGSGKTQILAKAATLVSGPRQVCLIRLGSVPVLPGDLPTTLIRWAGSAGLKMDPPTLERESFHFFLDGIDEIAPDRQEEVARTISQLAQEFPQHNFTVSSRPVPAATILSDLGWSSRQVELGPNWQHRYLLARGLTLEELMDGQEVHGELASLLQLPFFLSQAVELHSAGWTQQVTAWGLLAQLVTDALDKEGSLALLPVSVNDTRNWLQQSALAMRLSGASDLSQEAIQQIPLKGQSLLNDRFLQSMIDRSMLRDLEHESPDGPRVSFSHRIIGEFLAAEALLKVEPLSPILDAIAPVVGTSRSGVAPHWAVTVSLLMSQSVRWREAIKSRDRMLWAASVPEDAPVDERQEAARTIWAAYSDWKVWIWRRERSGFLQDGEALSRLLASEGLDDLVDEIRKGLDDPSPQTQSNALEVLSGARVSGLEPKMLEMLQDEARHSVVKRRVAVAAEDLGLVELVDALVEVATTTGDDAEAETCSSSALKLATDERLLEVAVKLAPDPLAGLMVMPGIWDRISPEGAVRVLRVQVEANVDDLPFHSEKDSFRDAVLAGNGTDPTFVEDAIFIAAAWGLADDSIMTLIDRHRDIAIRVIKEATTLDAEGSAWWHAAPLLRSFTAEEVEAAGYHEAVVRGRRVAEQREENPAEELPPDPEIDPFFEEIEADDELKLSEVLQWDREKGDPVLQRFPSELAEQVDQISSDEAADLQRRLDDWLKEDSFLSAFRFVSRSANGAEYRVDGWAHAWFWFGPALNLPLVPERWAQMALFGVAYDPQHKWLRSQATEESQEWLAKVGRDGDARDWRNALLSSPKPLSRSVLSAIERDLLSYTGEVGYDIEHVLQRLTDEGAKQAMGRVAANPVLTPAVNRHLAELGDENALKSKFEELRRSIVTKSMLEYESIPWLKGAQQEKYLPDLFECLHLHVSNQTEPEDRATRTPGQTRRRNRAIRGRMDETPNFLMETIQAIGGEGAARGYETLLLAEPEKARWLRFRLDQIEGTMFTKKSEEVSRDAAQQLGLPVFGLPTN